MSSILKRRNPNSSVLDLHRTGERVALRPARADELADLSALCLRSKAVWGYAPEFLAACKPELTLCPDDLANSRIAVAEVSGKIAGVAQVTTESNIADLTKVFVEPTNLRRGIGALLFSWACKSAREGGAGILIIESDPDAVPFYLRMGAVRAGHAPSGSIPGRMLPKLEFDLA